MVYYCFTHSGEQHILIDYCWWICILLKYWRMWTSGRFGQKNTLPRYCLNYSAFKSQTCRKVKIWCWHWDGWGAILGCLGWPSLISNGKDLARAGCNRNISNVSVSCENTTESWAPPNTKETNKYKKPWRTRNGLPDHRVAEPRHILFQTMEVSSIHLPRMWGDNLNNLIQERTIALPISYSQSYFGAYARWTYVYKI